MKRPILLLVAGASTIALGLAASPGDARTPDDMFIEKISSLRGLVLDRRTGSDRPPVRSGRGGVPALTAGSRETSATETPEPVKPTALIGTPSIKQTPASTAPTPPAEGSNLSKLDVVEVELVAPLTGHDSPASTLTRWNIKGTDLGITFEHRGEIYVVFGDTFGKGGIEKPDWRSNAMGVLQRDRQYGYVLHDVVKDQNGDAKELLASLKEPGQEYTVMPTAAIAVDDRMYIHYMSIRDWDEQWWGYKYPEVNGSGFAYSDDGGQTWTKDETARWHGDSHFTQAAMVRHEGHVYVFGTPAGRFVPARVMRVPEDHLLDPAQYMYWDGGSWSPNAADAAVILPWPVGELSVRWSEYHERWLMMYKNEVDHAIVLRTAPNLVGPWDEERVIVTADEFPSLYSPLIVPQINGPDVYFTMSNFFPYYNVSLMRATLERSD